MGTERQPAATFPRQTLQELASALGVHRNTISAWVPQGAPAGPPYCELQWRTWAAAQGKDLPLAKAPPEQALLDLLAQAGVPAYRRLVEQQRAAASGKASTAAGGDSGGQERMDKVDWANENKRLDALAKQRDYDLQMRRLIDREELIRLIEAIAEIGASVFEDAPGLVDALPLAPDDRNRVRAAVIEQLGRRRSEMIDGIKAKLQTYLETPPA